ncbi:MAG: hypothetical protein V3U67_08790 [Gemmatimonadota bacterium]
MKIETKSLGSGVVAGLLAATALIVLFFFIDLAKGQPLATPTFLSGALLGQEMPEATPLRIGAYTLAHYLAFVVLGTLAAIMFDTFKIPRNLTIGAAFGLFACSLVFYPALIITGTDILSAPAWQAVFFGNVLAGLVMVAYLHYASDEEGVTGLAELLRAHPVIRQGIVAGLIGAGLVAVWFLLVDMISGRPLFTPGALGSAILNGAGGMTGVEISTATVLGYTLIHLAAFLLFGVIVSGLVTQAEKFPPLVFGLLILFVVFETFFIVMVAMLGTWLMEELAWWSVLAGNFLAAASMGWYMWKVHPVLREELNNESLWAEP